MIVFRHYNVNFSEYKMYCSHTTSEFGIIFPFKISIPSYTLFFPLMPNSCLFFPLVPSYTLFLRLSPFSYLLYPFLASYTYSNAYALGIDKSIRSQTVTSLPHPLQEVGRKTKPTATHRIMMTTSRAKNLCFEEKDVNGVIGGRKVGSNELRAGTT